MWSRRGRSQVAKQCWLPKSPGNDARTGHALVVWGCVSRGRLQVANQWLQSPQASVLAKATISCCGAVSVVVKCAESWGLITELFPIHSEDCPQRSMQFERMLPSRVASQCPCGNNSSLRPISHVSMSHLDALCLATHMLLGPQLPNSGPPFPRAMRHLKSKLPSECSRHSTFASWTQLGGSPSWPFPSLQSSFELQTHGVGHSCCGTACRWGVEGPFCSV